MTLGQLVDVRSQRAEGIEAYYRSVVNRLDRTPWYRAGRMIPASAVAIPVRVLKEVTRPAPERRPGLGRDKEWDDRADRRRIDPEVAALYEQRVLEKRQEEVPWETERPTLRRAVILGGPGGGKTFLTLTTALALAHQGLEELERRSKPLEELPLPVWLELDTLGQAHWPRDPGEALVATLHQQYAVSAHTERWLNEVLQKPNCWLLLDALDQVRAENLGRLRERLEALERWPGKVLLTCRTANYDRARIPWGELSEYELALFGFTEIGALIDRWYGVDDPKGQRLKAVVEKSYALQLACRTPLVATLACLANEGQPLTEETRRGDLYAQVLRDLVRRAHRKDPLDAKDPHVDDLLEMLEPMAWELFLASPTVNQFTNGEVKAAIEAGAKAAKLDQPVTDLRDELVADGVLVWAGLNEKNQNQYSVLHRSFLEYLVACHMANAVKDQGWVNAKVQIKDREVPLHKVVDKKSWLAEWREVITLLAGKLDDGQPLIRLLKNKKTDDMFRHRLALAAHCLGELRDRTGYGELINAVTAEVWEGYWQYAENTSTEVIEHLERALPVLAEADGEVRPGERLLVNLQDLLWDWVQDGELYRAFEALRQMAPAARADFVDRLLDLLQLGIEDEDLRGRFARFGEMLAQMGLAARADIVDRLVELLRDPYAIVRSSAAYVLGQMGPAAARSDVAERLLKLLQHPDEDVRCSAALALGRMGPTVARADMARRLLEWLLDPHQYMALETFESMGQVAALADVVDRLIGLLGDPDWELRSKAASLLVGMGPAAAGAEVVDRLMKLLGDPHSDVRSCAAELLGKMRPAVSRADVLDRLLELLWDPDIPVLCRAAEALGAMGPTAARSDVVDRLLELLWDPDMPVLCRAAEALGAMGPTAARSDVVDSLLVLLRDPDEEVQFSAARALARMVPTVARADVVETLLDWLLNPDWDGMFEAAELLGQIGPAAARPDVVKGLAELLRDPEWKVWCSAETALRQIGPAVVQFGVVDSLLEMLWDPDCALSHRGDLLLGVLMRSGFRFFHHRAQTVRNVSVVPTSQLASLT